MIRDIKVSDYKEIYDLSCQHGYPFPEEEIKENIKTIINERRDKIFVETDATDRVVGYIHISPYKVLYFKPLANILGIVVDKSHRRKGIGRRLFNKDQDVNYPYTNNGVNYPKTRISDDFCFVAELNNDVIGFVTGALM